MTPEIENTSTKALPGRLLQALPFWLSLTLIPIAFIAAANGGWTLLLMPLATWGVIATMDAVAGVTSESLDPQTPVEQLFWHRAITLIWPPVQFATTFTILGWLTWSDHLATWEKVGVFLGIGIISGTIGIVYAHELMHQKGKLERWLGDVLMSMALYGHFRSEHLLVHHRYVATPRDPVTARYNEHFWHFYPRVLWQCLTSSWKAEKAMLARKGLPVWDRSNPFWRYITLDLGFLFLALVIGGWAGVGLFLVQAGFAIFQLELVNYVEHYGLTRKHLGGGKYEHTKPHHSWNATHKVSNWLLINLQRHSDHHYKPDRRFPLLQSYDTDEAPHLPYGYSVMTTMALFPPLWLKSMNPRVRAWRAMFYPEITDWRPYTEMDLPPPR